MASSWLHSSLKFWAAQHPAIARFTWKPPATFGSSPNVLISFIIAYLLLVFTLSLFLSRRRLPLPLGYIPAIHNLFLLLASLVMFLGCLEATAMEMDHARWLWTGAKTWQWLFCFPIHTRPAGRVFFWSYIYYLSKYYEFLDTFILVLKRKQLTVLHLFHHSLAPLMSFLWLHYTQSLQVIALLTNTAVHVFMYLYYFLSSLGIQPPWKKLVTNCQILQFLFSFAVSFVMLWFHFHEEGCAGFGAWVFNAFFNVTLLFLFLNFHQRLYRGSTVGKKAH